MAECPANQVSWWECPAARQLHHQAVSAASEERTAPLFAEADSGRRAWDAFNAHMLDGHPDDDEGG